MTLGFFIFSRQVRGSESPESRWQARDAPERGIVQALIADKVALLSPQEKIGQLFVLGCRDHIITPRQMFLLKHFHPGGFVLGRQASREQTAFLTMELQKSASLPLLIAVDQESGACFRIPSSLPLPSNFFLGKRGSSVFAYGVARFMAGELVRAGVNVTLAPVLDVNNNPGNRVIGERSFGASPGLVTRLGLAQVEGFRAGGIVPVVKHFPGHGDTATDSHTGLPVIDHPRAHLAVVELYPFRKVIYAGVEMVMVGHLLLPALDPEYPASLSPLVINSLLRAEYGFKGVVISDCFSMRAVAECYAPDRAVVLYLKAGGDLILLFRYENASRNLFLAAFHGIEKALKTGELTMERLDQSLFRIFYLKYLIFGEDFLEFPR